MTRAAAGEAAPVFTPAGELLFTSARPDPDGPEPAAGPPAALCRLPVTGEAAVAGSRPIHPGGAPGCSAAGSR